MAPSRAPACIGAPTWDPTTYLSSPDIHARAESLLAADDFAGAIRTSFALPARDTYVYHAMVSVTLAQVQHVLSLGGANGLHAWYRADQPSATASNNNNNGNDGSDDAKTKPASETTTTTIILPPPPRPDIDAYLNIFSPATSTPSALKTFGANAKKGSLRSRVAAHLASKRYIHSSLQAALNVPPKKTTTKNKKSSSSSSTSAAPPPSPPANPYLDFLAHSARALEWAGPCDLSERVRSSHHVLPVLMHHFGCVCPSYEALEVLRRVAAGREVIDMGSGNGYWSAMMRSHGVSTVVTPVDSGQSEWRTTWVGDTVVADGLQYLRQKRRGAPDAVLLLVYPIVGGGVAGGAEGGFTRGMMAAYRGDTLAVVGTQCRNGYTGFRDVSMDEYMEGEGKGEGRDEWVKIVQIPLPSFPGKDEALFIFQRGERR
ncbi:hypothetical protein F4778DRAFT_271294 [Xylariomycetidae sp. FL2044]|nr:hypothetical protein F4778DRAFT_271294 [Xylariomycetidae sp. FL2044]